MPCQTLIRPRRKADRPRTCRRRATFFGELADENGTPIVAHCHQHWTRILARSL